MRSAAPNFRSPLLIPLALLAACQDSPIAPPVAARTPTADVTLASTFVVTNTADADEGSLRAAIASAEATAGPDVITFAIGAEDPGCAAGTCTISLATQLDIASPDGVTIDGTGAGAVIVVSGNLSTRVLEVAAGAQATLRMLTIANGSHPEGAGILNAGTLRVEQSTVRDNVAGGSDSHGGGIKNGGALELVESTVTGNRSVRGGGVYNENTLAITMSSVTQNSAVVRGAGVYVADRPNSSTTIADSRIVGNEAGSDAAGLHMSNGTLTIVRTLIAANSAPTWAAGLYAGGTTQVSNTTISGNLGAYAARFQGFTPTLTNVTLVGSGPAPLLKADGIVTLRNTIIAQGDDSPACEGPGGVVDAGYNMETGTSCGLTAATSRSNTDPLLGPLADNGGQSFTHKLLTGSPGSPALNAIPFGVNGCGTVGATDQRGAGFARLVGPGCDIGAFEHQVPLPVFSGFLSPVKAGVVNQLNAGRVLPVNFTLGGDFGLTPFVTGYPTVTVTSCPASSAARYLIPLGNTVTGVKASKLNYNALTGQYTYLWVTEKSWAGSCRRLTLRFTNENLDRVLDVEFVR